MIKKDGLADMKVQLVIQHKGKAKKDDEQHRLHKSMFQTSCPIKN